MLTIEQCQRARLARDPRFDGKFFILVLTTGIFCRPVCRVRAPLEKNVTYALSAVEAMQRGFRPCLRCRPESAPQSFAWLGVKTTAKRAAQLLLDDVSSSVTAVASRLGVSERYLHKIMRNHFHVAPKQFRILHQVLLAKRLLHSSAMNIEQVAQGAGFSSARQLQHHMQKVMGLSPRQIRKRYQALTNRDTNQDTNSNSNGVVPSDIALKQHKDSLSILLSYQGDYDWPQLRAFFARRLITNNEHISQNMFSKTLCIDDNAVRVNMRHVPEKSGFEVSFSAQHVALTSQVIQQVSKILDLHANPYVISDALKNAGLKQEQINQGLRIPGISSRFEAGVRAILGQQVSVQAAITQVNRLQQGLQGDSDMFLRPEQLANADLGFLKMPGARKDALIAFAKLMADTAIADTSMAENEQANFDQWLAIKGIGPWTVNYVWLRATEDTDVWLSSDLIIKQQIAAFASRGQALDDSQASPWRSYLTLSLWNLS